MNRECLQLTDYHSHESPLIHAAPPVSSSIQGHGIVEVLRSENDKFKSGDFLHADVIREYNSRSLIHSPTDTLSSARGVPFV